MIFKTSDDELMLKIARGNHGAFRTLFDRHSSRVLGYCCRFMGSKDRGEDAAQEVWMKLVKAAQSYQGQGKFTSWILTVARTTCLSQLRAAGSLNEVPLDEARGSDETEDRSVLEAQAADDEKIAKMKKAIDALPDAQRAALTMWMVEELSYDDIAQHMGMSLSAVKSLLFRARQSLEKSVRVKS